MRWTAAIFPVMVGALVLAQGCGVPQDKYDADIAALQAKLDDANGQLWKNRQEIDKLSKEREALAYKLDTLEGDLEALTQDRDRLARAREMAQERLETFRSMLEKFRSMIESGKIKVKIVNNRMLVEMASAILFPSGKARLSKEGKKALTEVAEVLATITGRNFQVAGHTDNVPIRNARFKSNWALSSARAVAVVEHLVKNGMSAEYLSAAGYGETQPAVSNDTADGRAQNRRIEIVLQPNLDELPDLSSLEEMSTK
jgi:chemotaxis protein MotB